jgi:RNA polymerase sigma-70 factor, ECF subfamily
MISFGSIELESEFGDDRIVENAVSGDRVALTLLLHRTRRRLVESIAFRIPSDLRSELDSEDVVQDAQISACRRIQELRIPTVPGFNRWLAAIALHKLRDQIRKKRATKRGGARVEISARQQRSPDDSLVDLMDLVAGPGRTPSRCVARGEAVKAMQLMLDAIPEHYRRAISLVHLEGLPIAEAGERLGVTDRAIHGLLRRGLRLLRQHMGASTDYLSRG